MNHEFQCFQIDIDYEELCNNRKWERISIVEEMQRILPALKDLLQSYNITTLSVDLNQSLSLPFRVRFYSIPKSIFR